MRSLKRQPTARMTSAVRVTPLPEMEPMSPQGQAYRSWSAGKAPLPMNECVTGAPRYSAMATQFWRWLRLR